MLWLEWFLKQAAMRWAYAMREPYDVKANRRLLAEIDWHNENGEAYCGVYYEKRPGQAYSVCRGPRYQVKEQWEADARLISAAPDLLAALTNVRKLIAEAAMTGFNCHDGDWAERLFASQRVSSDAIRKATGTELRPFTPAAVDSGEDE